MRKIFCWIIGVVSFLMSAQERQEFIKSFISSYDLSVEARYSHEYHPFIFKKGIEAGDFIEKNISKICPSKGHAVIAGYQKGALPFYYSSCTSLAPDYLADEQEWREGEKRHSSPVGLAGPMLGFLLRNIEKQLPDSYHVGKKEIFIFSPLAEMFARHTFGSWYPLLEEREKKIVTALLCKDISAFYSLIGEFLFLAAQKFQAEELSSASQDIVFSAHSMKSLYKYPSPPLFFLTGADITFPINFLQAPRNACAGIKNFVLALEKHKASTFIFCSLVDGVGKSTLLSNSINYLAHGEKTEEYAPPDTTSSQAAQLFSLPANSFILDLPAHVSHFTFKPEGEVYVDSSLILLPEEQEELLKETTASLDRIKNEWQQKSEKVQTILRAYGWQSSHYKKLLDEMGKTAAYAKNIYLLKESYEKAWAYKSSKGRDCLYLPLTGNILVSCPLEQSPSQGLKNLLPEQYLFTSLSFPCSVSSFVSQVCQLLETNFCPETIFTHFTSIYPRSSRENVRLACILQLAAHIFGKFKINSTFYRPMSMNGQLYAQLKKKRWKKSASSFLKNEALIRWGLYCLLVEHTEKTVFSYSIETVVEKLSLLFPSLGEEELKRINKEAKKQVAREKERNKKHGKKQPMIRCVHQTKLRHFYALSQLIEQFYAAHGVPYAPSSYSFSDEKVVPFLQSPPCPIRLGEKEAEGCCFLAKKNESEHKIVMFSRLLRYHFYAAVYRLFFHLIGEKPPPQYAAAPLFLRYDQKGNLWACCQAYEQKKYKKGDVHYAHFWGLDEEEEWCHVKEGEYSFPIRAFPLQTVYGVYGYTYDQSPSSFSSLVFLMQQEKESALPLRNFASFERNWLLSSQKKGSLLSVFHERALLIWASLIGSIELVCIDPKTPFWHSRKKEEDIRASLFLSIALSLPLYLEKKVSDPMLQRLVQASLPFDIHFLFCTPKKAEKKEAEVFF